MGDRDPHDAAGHGVEVGHIHVDAELNAKAATRDLMASVFGLAGDLPSVVTAGCGQRVPYATTSPRPESVTCPHCREHAREQHLRAAARIEGLGGAPGSPIGLERAAAAAARHRELARRFA